MTEETPKPLLTPSYIGRIKRERVRNNNTPLSEYYYYHPTARKTVVKTIDLTRTNTLCEVNSHTKDNRHWEERWIEAYLINKAKKNDWIINNLAGKDYRFLASQFTFRKRAEWAGTKHIDLLLYDEKNKDLVVLELKADANSFPIAKQELEIYVKELHRLLKNEKTKDGKNAFYEAFGLETVNDIIGYIVYPHTKKESPIKEKDFRNYEPFRLIEYIKPWKEKFTEVKESGWDMEINFTCPKPVG